MVWCGFDEKMREGIITYSGGIAKAILKRAQLSGVSFLEQVECERKELATLEKVIIDRIETGLDSEEYLLELKAFLGLLYVARYVINKTGEDATDESFLHYYYEEAYAIASKIDEFEVHYSCLQKELTHHKKAKISLDLTFPKLGVNPNPKDACQDALPETSKLARTSI